MYQPTPEQLQTLQRRRDGLAQFLDERMPVLVEFCKALELSEPHRVLTNPSIFLSSIAEWVAQQDVANAPQQDRVWLVTRLGYFIGEYLIETCGGCWFLDENPDSRWYTSYVVGEFPRCQHVRVDPFRLAMEAVERHAGQSLEVLMREVSGEIAKQARKT